MSTVVSKTAPGNVESWNKKVPEFESFNPIFDHETVQYEIRRSTDQGDRTTSDSRK